VKRIVAMFMLAAVMTAMLALSASPAMAFIHDTVPAGSCAANPPKPHEFLEGGAGDNERAEGAIEDKNPVKGPVVEKTHLIVDAPAPSDVSCAHK
jgi:hypothetical protein